MVYSFGCCVQPDPERNGVTSEGDDSSEAFEDYAKTWNNNDPSHSSNADKDRNELERLLISSYNDIHHRQKNLFKDFSETFKSLHARQRIRDLYMKNISHHCHKKHDALGHEISPLVKLNVGGKLFDIKLDGLSLIQSDYNLMAILLSGRWNFRLPRDSTGRIFLNLDSYWMEPFLDSLNSNRIVTPKMNGEIKIGMDTAVSYYNLSDLLKNWSLSLPSPSTIPCMNMPRYTEKLLDFLQPELKAAHLTRNVPLQLLYRGSRDGFTPSDLHSRSNGARNTIFIIQATNGHVFGGYTEGAWQDSVNDLQNKKSFLFSLQGLADPEKFLRNYAVQQTPIKNTDQYLLFFGVDLTAASINCNVSIVGTMFSTKSHDPVLLAGTDTFTVKEIEIYHIEGESSAEDPGPLLTVDGVAPETLEEHANTWIHAASEQSDAINKGLRDMSREVELSEKKLLVELLWIEHLSAPAIERNILQGMLSEWQEKIDTAFAEINSGVETLDIVRNVADRLNITFTGRIEDEDDVQGDDEEKGQPQGSGEWHDHDDIASFNVGGLIVSVLQSTLLRQAPNSTFSSPSSDLVLKDVLHNDIALVRTDVQSFVEGLDHVLPFRPFSCNMFSLQPTPSHPIPLCCYIHSCFSPSLL